MHAVIWVRCYSRDRWILFTLSRMKLLQSEATLHQKQCAHIAHTARSRELVFEEKTCQPHRAQLQFAVQLHYRRRVLIRCDQLEIVSITVGS